MVFSSGAGYEWCEAGDGAGGERFAGAQVVVRAQAEIGAPALFEAGPSLFDPGAQGGPVYFRGVHDLGYLQQRLVCTDQDRAGKNVFGQKRALLVEHVVVAARLLDDLDEPDKAVVLVARRPLGRVDVPQVVALVVGNLTDLHALQGGGPARGVVGAALPGMVDGDEPRSFGIAGGRQITVPGEQLRVDLAEESPGFGDAFAPRLGDAEYAQCRQGVHRRLAEAAGRGRSCRGVGGFCGARPVLGTWEVALWRGVRVEDYVRDLAIFPLVLGQRPYLPRSPARVEVCQTDGDKGRVPAPLVRIERRGGTGPPAHVVFP